MKTDFLKELGLEKEVIDKIMAENGKDIDAEQKKVTKVEGERDNYKEQLDTATGQLEQFKDVKPEELQATIEQLKKDIKDKDDEYASKESDRIFVESINQSIKDAGGRNEKAVLSMLDIESLKASKNQIEDIKKALETVKESDAYLFGENEPINNPIVTHSGGAGSTDSRMSTMRAAMGLPTEEK
ncbi:MAG: phage scaffolding protein [Lachnospiraceae bacterium]